MSSFALLTTKDINLAASLSAFGCEFYQADPIRRLYESGKETVLFNFEKTTAAETIIKQWRDKSFVENNPEHPLAYCFCFMHNRERLLDLVKQAPAVQIVQKNGKIFFVPLKPTPQESQ